MTRALDPWLPFSCPLPSAMARWGAQRAGAAGRLALAALAVQLCAAAGQEEASARSATAAPPLRGPLPGKIGVVGVGTIGSALVQGILRAPPSRLADPPPFVLSPRNAAKAAALRAEFPSKVTVASSDQQVLDEAALVVLALPGSTAEGVLQALRFRQGLQVVSLIAAVKFPRLEALLGPGVNCTVALPMRAVPRGQRGVTLGFPWRPYAEAMFSVTGSYTAADSLEDFTSHWLQWGPSWGTFTRGS
ncbi:unnamed protein product [Prorocentrum cordatum]|uniref:Pyrroline-5-carboxylate reductase catalytic N-terminal domain-containing protein n=1 Tax=Prorocentrum cordatum TaxID=2364126 RepID=A0ABN9TFE1_9DINO|nr:unnamed protein product [Polarella glacialis]